MSRISCANTTLIESSVAVHRSTLPPAPRPRRCRRSGRRPATAGCRTARSSSSVCAGGTPCSNAAARMNGLNDEPGWCWVGGQVQLVLMEVLAREHRADRAVARVDGHDRRVGMGACRGSACTPRTAGPRPAARTSCHFGSSVVMIFRPPSNRVRLPRLLALARASRTSRSRSQDLADHVAHEERLVPLGDAFAGALRAARAVAASCAPRERLIPMGSTLRPGRPSGRARRCAGSCAFFGWSSGS